MARSDREEKGVGVTFKIGPGQKLMKEGDGPLYVGPRKKAEAAKPKPKPKPKPEVKPDPFANYKGQEQRFRPAPPKEEGKYNPLTNTTVMPGGKIVSGPVGGRTFGDVSPPKEKPVGKRFNPLTSTYYRDGGKVRGDGMSRVKTKGRCL